MKHTLTYTFVFATIAAGTLVHGMATGRWRPQGPSVELALPEVPMTLGNWQGENIKSGLADDKHQKNLARRYTHAKSGRAFNISLTVGPAGLTAQHTPEYCYPSSGYKSIGQPEQVSLPNRNDAFRAAVYRKDGVTGNDGVRILWAWSPDGTWAAPQYPELKYISGVTLTKLYIVTSDTERGIADDSELQDFLARLLTALEPQMRPAGS